MTQFTRPLQICLPQLQGPTDEFYAFGFSRGAFTIRVVMVILHQGLCPSRRSRIGKPGALALRAIAATLSFRISIEKLFRGYASFCEDGTYDASKNLHLVAYLLGLWDTVAADGLPCR